MISSDRNDFWKDAFTLHGSVTPRVIPYVLAFCLIALTICVVAWFMERQFDTRIGLSLAPYEFAGVALGLLLVLRTNAGYDRWWEARVLWGGIVNQTRNLVISSLAYGPKDVQWREQVARWTAVFPHIARSNLRGQPPSKEVEALVGEEATKQIADSSHMPSYVVWRIGLLLEEGCRKFEMDRFAFRQIDEQRARLIDHIGGCERILKTPLPIVYAIKIRRFITLYLLALPLALLHQTESNWAILLIPTVMALVSYPLISLDQIGVELQNPFDDRNLSHLPLNDISNTIEKNVLGFMELSEDQAGPLPEMQTD